MYDPRVARQSCDVAWRSCLRGKRCLRARHHLPENAQPSAWIVDFGGYGVAGADLRRLEALHNGLQAADRCLEAGSKEWLTFPNDAIGYAVYETSDFRVGPAGTLSLQSAYHGQDIDLRLGKA